MKTFYLSTKCVDVLLKLSVKPKVCIGLTFEVLYKLFVKVFVM
jgi:hypothetical protein